MLWLCLRTWWVSDRHSLDIEVGYALRCCCPPYSAPDWKCIEKFVKIYNYNQSLKHKVHRWVLSLRLNKYKLSASRTAAGTGRLFHTTGLATEKALSPNSCPWNSIVSVGCRAETSPCRITVTRLRRIGEVVWTAASFIYRSLHLASSVSSYDKINR